MAEEEDDWPPREARVRAALWAAEGHLMRGEWAQADRMLAPVAALADEPRLVRGLRRLAAAGYRASEHDETRAARHLAAARGLLGPFETGGADVDLPALVASVARAVAAPDDGEERHG